MLERYRELIGDRQGLVRVITAVVFGLIAGVPTAGRWQEWMLFRNATSFGTRDRQFDTDVGFYVFRLPFLSFLVGWLFASIVIITLLTAVAHYLNGGIRLQTGGASCDATGEAAPVRAARGAGAVEGSGLLAAALSG